MPLKFCPECGKPLVSSTAKFCPECGATLPTPASAPQHPSATSSPAPPSAQAFQPTQAGPALAAMAGAPLPRLATGYVKRPLTSNERRLAWGLVSPGLARGRGGALAGLVLGIGLIFLPSYVDLGQITGLGSEANLILIIVLLPVAVLLPLLSLVTLLRARSAASRLASQESAYEVIGFTEYHRRRLSGGFDGIVGGMSIRTPRPFPPTGLQPEDGKTNTLTLIKSCLKGFNVALIAVNGRPLPFPVPAIVETELE